MTDDGIAYGAENARDASEALSGGGLPVAMDFATWSTERLSRNARLPGTETTGVRGVPLDRPAGPYASDRLPAHGLSPPGRARAEPPDAHGPSPRTRTG